MRIGAVVLAAGKASRFGSPKQLLVLDGETLLNRTCRVAKEAGCDPVLRVLGCHAEAILSEPCPSGVESLVHVGWENGMGSSIAAGATRLMDLQPGLEAMVILLADQPSVSSQLIGHMGNLLQAGKPVLCDYGGVTGPPAMFPRTHFGILAACSGDRGAKGAAGSDPILVSFPGGRWDLDTLPDWERFKGCGDANPSP